MIDGEPVPYALARIRKAPISAATSPPAARASACRLSERDRWIAAQVGRNSCAVACVSSAST
jgi:glutathione synthase